jgi:hypothetical protein
MLTDIRIYNKCQKCKKLASRNFQFIHDSIYLFVKQVDFYDFIHVLRLN